MDDSVSAWAPLAPCAGNILENRISVPLSIGVRKKEKQKETGEGKKFVEFVHSELKLLIILKIRFIYLPCNIQAKNSVIPSTFFIILHKSL